MSIQEVKELVVGTLVNHGVEVSMDTLWDYFNGEETQEEIDKFVELFKWLEQDGAHCMTMVRVSVFLANPTFVNCCEELLEALEGQGMLE